MSKRKQLETEIDEVDSEDIITDEDISAPEPPKKRKRRQKLIIEEETQLDKIKFFLVALLMFVSLVMSLLMALLFDIAETPYVLNFIASTIFFIIGIGLGVILINIIIFGKSRK